MSKNSVKNAYQQLLYWLPTLKQSKSNQQPIKVIKPNQYKNKGVK